MTPPPTDEFEKLHLLREASDANAGSATEAWRAFYAFAAAAHSALGLEGCVTRKLASLRENLEEAEHFAGYEVNAELLARALKAETDRDDEVKRLTYERDTFRDCHKVAAEDNECRAAEYVELRTQHKTLVDAARQVWLLYFCGPAQQLGDNEPEFATSIVALNELLKNEPA